MAKNTDDFEREVRRALVAELYLKQYTQVEITKIIEKDDRFTDVTRQTITYDLNAIRKQWRETTTRNLDEDKERELSRIDALEREYWRQYEASMEDRLITSQEGRLDAKGQPQPTKASKRTETRTGDPRYLAGIQWCIQQRCIMLGLNEPETIRIKSWQDKAIEDIQAGTIKYQDLEEAFDAELASQLFARAGVPVQVRED